MHDAESRTCSARIGFKIQPTTCARNHVIVIAREMTTKIEPNAAITPKNSETRRCMNARVSSGEPGTLPNPKRLAQRRRRPGFVVDMAPQSIRVHRGAIMAIVELPAEMNADR